MKKIFLVMALILLCGCGKEETYNVQEVIDRGGILCNDYAAINKKDAMVIYKANNKGIYEKDFDIKKENIYTILVTDKLLFLIDVNDSATEKVMTYELDGNHSSNTFTADFYSIMNIYGIKDNYLYFTYYDKDNNLRYGKLSTDLKEFNSFNDSKNIPETFDYIPCE